ncbi:PucR family transcriptional regulator [Tissierellaceae bacterium HCP3S3_D8]
MREHYGFSSFVVLDNINVTNPCDIIKCELQKDSFKRWIKVVTVEEILGLPVLRKLKVIAGHRGLNKRVSCLTVMEVPDVTRWLKGHDFIITSFYAVKDDIDKQIELIDKLADLNCSCLAIKLGQYVKELDSSIIERADDRGLVLAEIPWDITYIEIIVNGMEKILHDRDIDYMIEKYMKDIIFDNYEDYETATERGELLGFKIRNGYSLAITLINCGRDTDEDIKTLRKVAKKIAKKSDILLKYTYNPVVTVEEKSTILFFVSELKDMENNLDKIIDVIQEYLREEGLEDIKIGVGSIGRGLKGIKETYYNSLEVLKLIEILDYKTSIYFYDELKIYLSLDKLFRIDDYNIFDDIYGKLGDDLLLTLEKYHECNMDIAETAKQLYVHQNTVRYRLNKIKDITGYDVFRFEDNFKLHLFLIYDKIKKLP